MSHPLRVLLVEDAEDFALVIVEELKRAAYVPVWERVDTSAAMLTALDKHTWDVVLADYSMPNFSGLEALQLLKSRGLDLPFIIVSGVIGEETAVAAMKAGANDYVTKLNLERLAPAIERALREVTERRQRQRVERDLQASQRQYQELVDSLDEIIWEANVHDFRFTFVSHQCERLLGYSRRYWLRELTWRKLIYAEDQDRMFKAWRKAIAEKRNHALEFRLIAADGRIVWVRNITTLILDQGMPVKLRGALVDITERKQLTEQLRQTQKLETIGQLAGGVAHDFNNILTVIQGYTQLLLMKAHLDAEIIEPLKQIHTAADKAAVLTRQLLAFSRGQVMTPRPVDVNEIVNHMIKLLRRIIGEDIDLQFDPAQHLPLTEADSGMLEQVIMNLAVNARDAMPEGGQLFISTACAHIDELYVQVHSEARVGVFVCLQVQDIGSGMPPEILEHIFEPFFTTKEAGKGTGLGLATVYGIVKQHGGWIEVISEPGQGTTFKVFLPASAVLAREAANIPASAAVRGGTETILLVEDEPVVRSLAQTILEQYGYHVLEAASGVEALAIWAQHQSHIDLLLTDLVMPDGMTGRELAETLKAAKPALHVIFTTGYSVEEVGSDLVLREGLNFLRKPYRPDILAQAVRHCLDGNQRKE